MTRQAIPHALAASAFDLAVELILAVADQMEQSNELVTFSNWIKSLPDQVVRASYQLSTYKGWFAFMVSQIEHAASYAQSAEKLVEANYGRLTALRARLALVGGDASKAMKLSMEGLEQIGSGPGYARNQPFRNALLNNLGEALWLSGETDKAAKHFRQVIYLENRTSSDVGAYVALCNLASLLHLQGQRQEAMRLVQQGLDQCEATFGPQNPLVALMHLVLGRAHYEANQLEKAESHLGTALELSLELRYYSSPTATLIACAIYAQLQQATTRYHDALKTLQEAKQLTQLRHDTSLARLIRAIAAKVHLQQGNMAAAVDWAERVKFSFERHPGYMLENEELVYARVLLAQNKLAEAQTLLAQLEQFTHQIGFKARLIVIHTLQARASQALGDSKQALTYLSCAIRLAAPNHYRRIFIEEGHPIANLLPQMRIVAPTFVSSLLPFLKSPSNAPLSSPLIEPLSERELEVLQLIAQGFTNRQIADHLFVAPSTVKWHARNIYGKLGVRKRTQAVARARDLNLL